MTDGIFDLNAYDYPLAEEQIAQTPANPRDMSRLLVWDPASGKALHRRFRDLTEFLRPDDLLVLNDTRVLPARLLGTRPNGGAAEVLLLSPASPDFCLWHALVRPGRRLRAGAEVRVEGRTLRIEAEEPEGVRLVRVEGEGRKDILAFMEAAGQVPLPPYIHADGNQWRDAYQTVFARREGSVAAPTASLHFTASLLEAIQRQGVQRAWVTLHVGLGTFRPVKAADIRDHAIHKEYCEVPEATAQAIRECRGRVVAVGTTVARTLESLAKGRREVAAGPMETGLFIWPGFRFQVVDALITNFHLPKSSLLMLVAAFASQLMGGEGSEQRALSSLLALYARAAGEGYRFFSFGDAMLITGDRR